MHLPNIQSTKSIIKYSLKCKIPVNIRYEVICKKLWIFESHWFGDDESKWKELFPSDTTWFFCILQWNNSCNSLWDKSLFIPNIIKTICQHIIDNLNYYKYCVEVSKIWDTNNGTDANGFERIFNPENNEDGVSAFDKDGDEYNVASASKTVLSSVYNTLFDKLSVKYVIENIDKIPVTIAFPDSQMLDIIVLFDPNNYSTSNRSNKSDNESHVASLD